MGSKTYVRTLTIAGSDSGGGAGIQADLKTFSALGCYGMSVITALTAQNTVGLKSVFDVSAAFISEQLDAVLDDIGVDAVKIGMLHRPDVIRVIAERLRSHAVRIVVVDPVMISKSGHALLQPDAVSALKEEIIPLATILTPNLPEAEVLLRRKIKSSPEMEMAAHDLANMGAQGVLLKGGHSESSKSDDFIWFKGDSSFQRHWLRAARVDTQNTHGTGCTLSSAIAALLARGFTTLEAVQRAKIYLTRAISAGAEYRLGHGHGPVQHFHGELRDLL